ncbi:AAA family ATPase [Caballeronia sp. LZ008]|uniref:nuclease-related domain-containing DEAD/DEAH box helicase n=1 Tax=unclassified Caballeronia TaxID=2646786 RepID=UPI002028B003|nr:MULTISPECIES: AAA family ATPase [unclassified Caballeronia]MDR5796484.1 AAA family ATPase [Caballeronia sp. LZ008]
MANMIPVFGPVDSESRSEPILYRILKEQLSDEFTVIHSLPWLCAAVKEISESFAPTGEIDFLLIHRDLGILALEAKDGAYGVSGVHFVHLRLGTTITPVHQVRRNVHGLAKWLGVDKTLRFRIGYGLVFPDSEFGDAIISSALIDVSVTPPQSIVIDKKQIPQLGARVVELMKYWRRTLGYRSLPKETVDKLIQTLCPKFDGSPTWGTRVLFDSRIWLPLTAEQCQVVGNACRQARSLITGWPGTGKTLVGLAIAREMVRQGKRVLFLTFNSRLTDYIAKQLSFSVAEGVVSTWHSLCAQARKRIGRADESSDDDWFQAGCLADLQTALEGKLLGSYDVLILDEAQALRPEWSLVLLAWFRNKKVVAFCDETQAFSFEKGATLRQLTEIVGVEEPFRLTIVLRMPKAVTERLLQVKPVGYQLHCPRLHEPDTVQELVVEDNNAALMQLIDRFKVDGVMAHDIVVLTKFQLPASYESALIDLGVGYEVVSRFRGLEAPVVVALGAEGMADGQLFCAYSRATTAFVALYNAKAIAWLETEQGRFLESIMQDERNQALVSSARQASMASTIIETSVEVEWLPLRTVKLGWCVSWGAWVMEASEKSPDGLWLDYLTSHYEWSAFCWHPLARETFRHFRPVGSLINDISGLGTAVIRDCERCGPSPHIGMNWTSCVFCSGAEERRPLRPSTDVLVRLAELDRLMETSVDDKAVSRKIGSLPISLAAYRAHRYVEKHGAGGIFDLDLPYGRIVYRAALALVQSQIQYLKHGSRIETDGLAKGWYERYDEIRESIPFADWKAAVANAVSTCFQSRKLLSKLGKGVYSTVSPVETKAIRSSPG